MGMIMPRSGLLAALAVFALTACVTDALPVDADAVVPESELSSPLGIYDGIGKSTKSTTQDVLAETSGSHPPSEPTVDEEDGDGGYAGLNPSESHEDVQSTSYVPYTQQQNIPNFAGKGQGNPAQTEVPGAPDLPVAHHQDMKRLVYNDIDHDIDQDVNHEINSESYQGADEGKMPLLHPINGERADGFKPAGSADLAAALHRKFQPAQGPGGVLVASLSRRTTKHRSSRPSARIGTCEAHAHDATIMATIMATI